jgi:hypothetical protein
MLEGCQSGMTWCSDVTQGDVDPRLTCRVSPKFVCITYPIGPLERNMCHPDPSYVSVPGTCPPSQHGW